MVLGALVSGCSGSGGGNPVVPEPGDVGFTSQNPKISAQSGGDNHTLWGYYLVYVNPAENDFEILPVHNTSAHWNILTWLENGPCTTCFSIDGITISPEGNLLVDIKIDHPFPSPNLTGFDVRGIAMFNGSMTMPDCGLVYSDSSLGDGELLNPDGYTTLYNTTTAGMGPGGLEGYLKGKFATPTFPNAILNGYKRFVSDDVANTRNAFYAGASIVETFEVKMPDGTFVFGYAVDANWAKPLVDTVTNPMTDFPLIANCPEPWQIIVSGDPISSVGETILTIDVYDYGGNIIDADPVLECPDLFDGTLTCLFTQYGPDYSRYIATVQNEKIAPPGTYRCLVSVEDSENDPDLKPWLDLTAYQFYNIEILDECDGNLPPEASAFTIPDPAVVEPGESIEFFDSSTDIDGANDIVLWEWDFDYQGPASFEPDIFTQDAVWEYWLEGVYEVMLRVTDRCGNTDMLDEPIMVTVEDSANSGWALSWATSGGWIWNTEVASDNNGYVYVTGEHDDGDYMNACVRKVSTSGEEAWTITFEGEEGWSIGDGIAIDDLGNIYIAGLLSGPTDLDPGPGEDIHEPVAIPDAYLAKFDSDGIYQWGHHWGGDLMGGSYYYEKANGVAVDSLGGVYVCGNFRGTCDFDPGPDVFEAESNGGEMGGFDAYVTKFNSSGEFEWARTWGSDYPGDGIDTWVGETAWGVAVDSADNIYLTTGFLGTVDFDPGPEIDERTSTEEYGDVAILKWTSDGDYVWVKNFAAIGYCDFPGTAQGWGGSFITVDNNDDIYAVGTFEGEVDFDPGPGEEIVDATGGYVNKLTSDGDFVNALVWEVDNLLYFIAYGVYADSNDDIYVAGSFSNELDLDPGPGEDLHTCEAYRDAFVARFDSAGNYAWANSWGAGTSTNFTEGWGVTVDENDNPYVVGFFQGLVDFDPGDDEDNHLASGTSSYLVKFRPDGSW